jgi:hypothetical protein
VNQALRRGGRPRFDLRQLQAIAGDNLDCFARGVCVIAGEEDVHRWARKRKLLAPMRKTQW